MHFIEIWSELHLNFNSIIPGVILYCTQLCFCSGHLGSDWVGFVSWVSPLKSRQTPFKREKQKLFNVLQLKQTDKTVGKCSATMQIDRLSYYSSISEKCECQQKSGTGWCEILGGRERHLFPLIIKEAVESCLEEIVLVSRHTAESHYPGEFQVSVWILSLPCYTQWNVLSLMSLGFWEAVTDYLSCQPQF